MLDNLSYKDTQYVILIAFPRQRWLRERPSMLLYTYIACFVVYCQWHVTQKHTLRNGYAKRHNITLQVHTLPVLLYVKWHSIGGEYNQRFAVRSSTYLPNGQLHQLILLSKT